MSPGNCWGHTFLGLQKAHVLSVLTAGWICHRGTFRERESGLSWSGGPAGLGSGARPLHGGVTGTVRSPHSLCCSTITILKFLIGKFEQGDSQVL